MDAKCVLSRHELLKRIQIYEFALVDINLYLNTHPTDREALDYYHYHHELLERTTREYNESYGPLTPGSVLSTNKWTWIEHPWPWEMEA